MAVSNLASVGKWTYYAGPNKPVLRVVISNFLRTDYILGHRDCYEVVKLYESGVLHPRLQRGDRLIADMQIYVL